ncbi:hypothetical protein EDB84DRAFT_1559054 [Lactarius hengduanensis]|nr:hypothetical protein EDB84DRAFT_1559054 [Lactarius hengduanensis]
MAASLSLTLLTSTRALSRCPHTQYPPANRPPSAPANTSPLTTPTLRAPELLAAAPPTCKTFS